MLHVDNLQCSAGSFALSGIMLTVNEGQYSVLLGPTGCGKTTLLRCLSGLIKAQGGKVTLNDRDITGIPPRERNVGLLPQDYCLFPHLDVRHNIAFGLVIRKKPPRETELRVNEMAELLRLDSLLSRTVSGLSGGERQRVALARALAVNPHLLLLDEPFSAVDPGLRTTLWFEVKEMLKTMNVPVIHVTHSIDEAAALGDTVTVMIEGRTVQTGSPEEIFTRPLTRDVAEYQGIRNFYEGEIVSLTGDKATLRCQGFEVVAVHQGQWALNQQVLVCVRPQDIKILREGYPVREELADNVFCCHVRSLYLLHDMAVVTVCGPAAFELRLPLNVVKRHALTAGKTITCALWQKNILLYPLT
ncbi:MAG: ABC transporter ATP-binding protein [Vulcanimicrobiota bacterium]